MKDCKHTDDEKVRELSLKTNEIDAKSWDSMEKVPYDELLTIQAEWHYHNTVNAFVELIVVYGYDKVIGDLRQAMGEKTW